MRGQVIAADTIVEETIISRDSLVSLEFLMLWSVFSAKALVPLFNSNSTFETFFAAKLVKVI